MVDFRTCSYWVSSSVDKTEPPLIWPSQLDDHVYDRSIKGKFTYSLSHRIGGYANLPLESSRLEKRSMETYRVSETGLYASEFEAASFEGCWVQDCRESGVNIKVVWMNEARRNEC